MTARTPGAFMLSVTLHSTVVAALFLLGMISGCGEEKLRIVEIVAGPGDDFNATAAPKLGSETGETAIKVAIPAAPAPAPTPELSAPEPAPIPATPPPVTPAPTPKPTPPPVTKAETPAPPPPKKAEPKQRTVAQELQRKIANAQAKAKREVQKERDAEEKAQKAAAEKAKSAAKAPNIARIDTKGISNGLLEGSANSKAGAGGKALTSEEGSAAERYISMLIQKLTDELDRTPGLDDGLRAEVDFVILSNGTLGRAKISKSSSNEAFDRAVVSAINAMRMPPRPKGVDEVQTGVPFTTHAKQ